MKKPLVIPKTIKIDGLYVNLACKGTAVTPSKHQASKKKPNRRKK